MRRTYQECCQITDPQVADSLTYARLNVPYLSCEGMGTEIMTEKIGRSIKANPITRNIMLKSRIT